MILLPVIFPQTALSETKNAIETVTITPTTIPTLTEPEIATLQLTSIPVAHNEDWIPVEQEINGVRMVLVPAGQFQMGDAGDSSIGDGGLQKFDAPFWIGKTEVTNAQYRMCVDVGACKPLGDTTYYDDPAYADYPIAYVDWFQATAYAAWFGGRLPTEAEWEYAARGPDGLTYPWGNEFNGTRLNFCDQNCDRKQADPMIDDGFAEVAPVGSYPEGASWVGALDMSGNVWEWVSSLYLPYPFVPLKTEDPDLVETSRGLRGGSFSYSQRFAGVAAREGNYAFDWFDYYGLRVVLPLDTSEQSTIMSDASVPVAHNTDWTPVEQDFNGIMMVLVPAGQFLMGDTGEGGLQVFATPFWIGKTEVTNAQYKRCVDANECELPSNTTYYNKPDYADHPVVYLNWYQAKAYAAWWGLGKQIPGQLQGRLPTEAEWEYAARGPDNWKYPWGNRFNGTLLNFCDKNCGYDWADTTVDDGYAEIAPAGSYPDGHSWVGALDMSGNVWEWMNNLTLDYPYGMPKAETADNTDERATRGGSFGGLKDFAAASIRSGLDPLSDRNPTGFRVVVGVPIP
ncbi:MAG TPA: SUMF1/EgtB/PvdO family nonheme iron enzyme [Phototrophicaceae bacterium]|nr:SUMF1/EgtB/PvdO family nonheme iron enzyme [Phototrophicaceae bacterium]